MRFGSICSGIEAASVAWKPLGWQCAFMSEIEAFPRAVLQHHYPDVPLHGDFTTIGADEYGSIDLLCGGTPCQSFSVAGLRGGLDDERGNLSLEFLKLAQRKRPRWVVWENVAGVLSSNGGRDFGSIVGGLGKLGYGWAYRVLDAQYVRVDGFGRAVPQRRRRVVLVGHLGDWRRAAAVLFERESLFGHTPPSRETGENASENAGSGVKNGSHWDGSGVHPSLSQSHNTGSPGYSNQEVSSQRGAGLVPDVCGTLSDGAHNGGGLNGQDAYTGRIIPVAIQERAISENPNAGPDGAGFRQDGAAYTLEARTVPQAVAFSCKDHGADASDNVAPTMRAMGHAGSHANAGGQLAVAMPMAVRRLTPIECERLMGFPDDYTRIPYRNKPADKCPDGPRYKALGNSWAVNVFRWVGIRIEMVDRLAELEAAG